MCVSSVVQAVVGIVITCVKMVFGLNEEYNCQYKLLSFTIGEVNSIAALKNYCSGGISKVFIHSSSQL
jgi:hypothetical protein